MDIGKMNKFVPELKSCNNRVAGILAGAFLESLLDRLLDKFIIKNAPKDLYNANGPLNHFSNKTLISYSMGLISEEENNNLNIIRKIRNHCAHALGSIADSPVAFSKGKLHDLCKEFIPSKWIPKLRGKKKTKYCDARNSIFSSNKARKMFNYIVLWTAFSLFARIELIDKKIVPPNINE